MGASGTGVLPLSVAKLTAVKGGEGGGVLPVDARQHWDGCPFRAHDGMCSQHAAPRCMMHRVAMKDGAHMALVHLKSVPLPVHTACTPRPDGGVHWCRGYTLLVRRTLNVACKSQWVGGGEAELIGGWRQTAPAAVGSLTRQCRLGALLKLLQLEAAAASAAVAQMAAAGQPWRHRADAELLLRKRHQQTAYRWHAGGAHVAQLGNDTCHSLQLLLEIGLQEGHPLLDARLDLRQEVAPGIVGWV